MPDITSLPPHVQRELMRCHADMLALIDVAMHHMVVDHGITPAYNMDLEVQVIPGPPCPEGVVLLCGASLYAKLQALQLKAKTIHADAVTAQVLEKAKNA